MRVLPLEVAKEILNLFGSCTTLYECTDVSELQDWFNEGKLGSDMDLVPYDSVNEFVIELFKLEALNHEQGEGVRSHIDRPWSEQKEEVAENVSLLEGARQRLTKAGYEVPR